jgi:hypothetical protein
MLVRNLSPVEAESRFAKAFPGLQASMALPALLLQAHGQSFRVCAAKLAEEPPAFIALLTDERLLGPETQNNGHVVLKDLRNGLLQLARSMGGTGGIWTQQISPELYQADPWHGNVVDKSETECLGVRGAVMAVIYKLNY